MYYLLIINFEHCWQSYLYWLIYSSNDHLISDPFLFLWLKGSIKANVLRSLSLKKFFHNHAVESSLSKKVSGWPLVLELASKTWENVHLWHKEVSPWKFRLGFHFQMTFWLMTNTFSWAFLMLKKNVSRKNIYSNSLNFTAFHSKISEFVARHFEFRTQKRSNSSNFKIFSGAFFSLLGDFRQLPGV